MLIPGKSRDTIPGSRSRFSISPEYVLLPTWSDSDGQVPTCERIRWVASIFGRTPYMVWLVWTTLWFVGDFSEMCWRWNITPCSNENFFQTARRRVVTNSMRRVDFPTRPIHAAVSVEDVVVCMQFFGNILAIKYDTRCYFNVRSKADISQLKSTAQSA